MRVLRVAHDDARVPLHVDGAREPITEAGVIVARAETVTPHVALSLVLDLLSKVGNGVSAPDACRMLKAEVEGWTLLP